MASPTYSTGCTNDKCVLNGRKEYEVKRETIIIQFIKSSRLDEAELEIKEKTRPPYKFCKYFLQI